MKRHDIYCGGTFLFDVRQSGCYEEGARDFRSLILGGLDNLMNPPADGKRIISGNVAYIGPYYFETNEMKPEDIVRREKKMIEECTDAIFLLDDASCPGSIAELMYAFSLGKALHIFYVRRKDSEETESDLHSPCWYPITFCKVSDYDADIHSCESYEDAACNIRNLIDTWR